MEGLGVLQIGEGEIETSKGDYVATARESGGSAPDHQPLGGGSATPASQRQPGFPDTQDQEMCHSAGVKCAIWQMYTTLTTLLVF